MPMQYYQVSESKTDMRLDLYLTNKLATLSRAQVQQLIKSGAVTVNGQPGKAALRVFAGDNIHINLPDNDEYETTPQPEDIPLDVLYEDDDLIVLHKPAGLVVHPAPGHPSGTLVNALLARYPNLVEEDYISRYGLVHRLDKNTSGIMLVARHAAAHEVLVNQFQARTVHKTYWALCDRHPKTNVGRVDAPIARDQQQRKRMAIVHNGKEAITEYQTLELYDAHSLIQAHPKTGRMHQIRVHLAFIGCPVVGDVIYGQRKPTIKLKRHFLHAKAIRFTHPRDGRDMAFDTDLPPNLQHVLERLAQQRDQ